MSGNEESSGKPKYANLPRRKRALSPVTTRQYPHTSYSQSESHHQDGSFLHSYPPPLHTQRNLAYTPVSHTNAEGGSKNCEVEPVYIDLCDIDKGRFPPLPDEYVEMLSGDRVHPYHTFPALHSAGSHDIDGADHFHRTRYMSDSQTLLERQPANSQSRDARSQSFPSLDPPKVLACNLLPQEEEATQKAIQRSVLELVDPTLPIAIDDSSGEAITCVPMYMSMETGTMYVVKSMALAFYPDQIVDVKQIAKLPLLADSSIVAPSAPISDKLESSPTLAQPSSPAPLTNIGRTQNPIVSDSERQWSSSGQHREPLAVPVHVQALESHPAINSHSATIEGCSRFVENPNFSLQHGVGHSYFYLTIIVTAILLICLDFCAFLVCLLPALYCAKKASTAKQLSNMDEVKAFGRKTLILNIAAIVFHIVYIIVLVVLFFVFIFFVVPMISTN